MSSHSILQTLPGEPEILWVVQKLCVRLTILGKTMSLAQYGKEDAKVEMTLSNVGLDGQKPCNILNKQSVTEYIPTTQLRIKYVGRFEC